MSTVTLQGMKMVGTAVQKPDGAPSYWQTVMRINRGAQTVSFSMRGGFATFTCNAVDDYTVETESSNITSVADITGNPDEGQRIVFSSKLPSTNDHGYLVRLVSQSGDARLLHSLGSDGGALYLGRDAGDSNRVAYVEVGLADVDGPVAPQVGATYTFEITFWRL